MTERSKSPLGPERWRVALESIGDAVITTAEQRRSLPSMSGHEVAKRLREQVSTLGKVVLVALTGY